MMGISDRIKANQDTREMLKRAIKRDVDLYSEKTHFIYELLQNAEDAEATVVEFIQHSDFLEVLHNGKPFTESNINSLCDIANSDKGNAKIGKFGVGFKAVFTVCETVQVFSEPINAINKSSEERFALEIQGYTVPVDLEDDFTVKSPYTTKFVFPYSFGEYYKTIDELRVDLAGKLRSIGSSVLLFMKNIKDVKYSISGINSQLDGNGFYMLDRKIIGEGCSIVNTIGENDVQENDESYLVYSKNVLGTDRAVDVAFSFIEKDSIKNFIKSSSQYVSVYFPTEAESKLNFIIQGSYELTSNRSSLKKDSKINTDLIALTAELLHDAVLDLKKRGWLTLELLMLLPYKDIEGTTWVYNPLKEEVSNILSNEEVIPTDDGLSYVKAADAKIARGDWLIELFPNAFLCELLKEPNAKWIFSETKARRDFQDYLTDELHVISIRPESIPTLINDNNAFLASTAVDMAWLIKLYNTLAEKVKNMLGRKGDFSLVPFVKTTNGEFVASYKLISASRDREANVFIKPQDSHTEIDGICFFNEQISRSCPEFVQLMGLTEPDKYNYFIKELENLLCNEEVSDESLISHAKQAIRFIKNDENGTVIQAIGKLLPIVCMGDFYTRNNKDKIYRQKDKNGISIIKYYENMESSGVQILDEDFYRNGGISDKDLDVLNQIGIKSSLYDFGRDLWYDGNAECRNAGNFKKELSIANIYDANIVIEEGTAISKEKSAIILNLLNNVANFLSGFWEYGKVSPKKYQGTSKIIGLLKQSSWLYDKNGEWVKSSTITSDDLDQEVYGNISDYAPSLFEALGFKKTVKEENLPLLKQLQQLSKDRLEILLKELGSVEIDDDFDPTVDIEYKDFPMEAIKDLKRLQEATRGTYDNAPAVRYKQIFRSIRTSRMGDRQEIGHRYRGYCQMCEKPSQFWEVAELFNNPQKEIEFMNLSLCPSCASEYRYMRNDDVVMAKFKEELKSTSLVDDLSVQIGEEKYIRFTKRHLAEIQTLLSLEK